MLPRCVIILFIQPFGMVLTLCILGLYFLLIRKYNLAKVFTGISIALVLLFSHSQFSNFLIKNLEMQYPKYKYNKPVKYIQILGDGNRRSYIEPLSSHLNSAGIKRVIEGVLIYKKTKNAKLIFSGYSNIKNAPQTAQVYADLAISLGVKTSDIIKCFKAKDTKEEAIFAKQIVKKEPFVLVTSASHMPRAMMIFQDVGLNPIPAPTDYHSYIHKCYTSPINSFVNSQLAIHEYIGLVWIKLKKLLTKSPTKIKILRY